MAFDSLSLFWRQPKLLPQTLILFVTSRCNARCRFCLYYDQIQNPAPPHDELTADEVDAIARSYGPLHYLALSGGEPFLRHDLDALCQRFIDRCGTAVIDIPSNFYYTDSMLSSLRPLVEKNARTVFDVQLSLDHVGSKHDESRHVPGLYARAVTTFRELSKLREAHPNLKLKINIVYLPINKDELAGIRSEIGRTFAYDRIQLSYPNKTLSPGEGNVRETEAFSRSADELEAAAPPHGAFELHNLGLAATKKPYRRLLREAASGRRNVGSYCEAGKQILVINEKGDVFPCEPLWHSLGNLRQSGYDVPALLNSEAYRTFRAEKLGAGKCNCTWGCAMLSHISVTPSEFPAIGLEAARQTIKRVRSRIGVLNGNGS